VIAGIARDPVAAVLRDLRADAAVGAGLEVSVRTP
jgi:hypothetical protein